MKYSQPLLLAIGPAKPSDSIQRCDAKHPCTRCTRAKGITECVYDYERLLQPVDVYPLNSTSGHLSGQQLRSADLVELPVVLSMHPPSDDAMSNPNPSTSDAMQVVMNEPRSQIQIPDIVATDLDMRSYVFE